MKLSDPGGRLNACKQPALNAKLLLKAKGDEFAPQVFQDLACHTMNQFPKHSNLAAALVRAKLRLVQLEQMPAETISDRISRTQARCQMRARIAQIEASLALEHRDATSGGGALPAFSEKRPRCR